MSSSARARRIAPVLLAAALAAAPAAGSLAEAVPASPLADADRLWARRAEAGPHAGTAADPLEQAIAGYQAVLDRRPDDLEARWKLLRALYYAGEFRGLEGETRHAVFERGRRLAVEGVESLRRRLAAPGLDPGRTESAAETLRQEPQAAPFFFWAAVHWGLWAEQSGKLKAARHGVARKIRDYARLVIALDERYEHAGGLRLLGRLHTEAPRVPFVTGWVSRTVAIDSLERAVALAPDDLWNRFYLGDALLRFRPQQRPRATRLIREVAAATPRPDSPAEDARCIAEARRLAARLADPLPAAGKPKSQAEA